MNRLVQRVAVFGACVALLGAAADPGVHVRIDLARFELIARDARRPDDTLVLRVATGSPAHPTPAGRYRPWVVVRNPAWRPGPSALARGAREIPASAQGPMGIAKIPLDASGFAVHGGADPLLLGKPVSLGCVRLADADMRALLDWLDAGGVLAPARGAAGGELRHALRRRVAFEVR